MLVLSRAEIEALLDVDALIDALASAMDDLSAERASVPPRVAAVISPGTILAAMPGFVPSAGALVTKVVSLFPSNAGTSLPTHQAVIVAFDPATGEPAALMDGTYITAVRTGAGSALATRLLAREDARTMAILGTGVQARSHIRAVPRVRPIEEIRIAGRDPAKAERLAAEVSGAIKVVSAPTFQDAMEGADVVCAVTHTVSPVVRRDWVSDGMHINSVGFNVAGREVDAETFRDALLVVESRAGALSPPPAGAPDLTAAIAEGAISSDHVHAEIGELVAGTKPGRTSPTQITLYRSVGVAAQDAAAAALVLEAARAQGVGRTIDL